MVCKYPLCYRDSRSGSSYCSSHKPEPSDKESFVPFPLKTPDRDFVFYGVWSFVFVTLACIAVALISVVAKIVRWGFMS